MKYYVQKGTCIGKVFVADNDDLAIAWAKGYATAKKWQHFHVIRIGVENNDGSTKKSRRKSA